MRKLKKNFYQIKKKYLSFLKKQEITGEPFYDKLGQLEKFYIPICIKINEIYTKKKRLLILGLAGGQGSGKSTIAKILSIILKQQYNLKVLNISIDDYYKSLADRKKMTKFNDLFLTRGVPGTHDTLLLNQHLKFLKKKRPGSLLLPKFDKSQDDRMSKKHWKKVKNKFNIIIFEGWCVGAAHEKLKNLKKPINILERHSDKKLTWRRKVNYELKNNYKKIFDLIDFLIFLKVPSFNYVFKWRLLQEEKLKKISKGKKIMNQSEIKKFIMHYERITKNMIRNFQKYDVTINLDKKHRLKKISFR